jgi:hypothetical protein
MTHCLKGPGRGEGARSPCRRARQQARAAGGAQGHRQGRRRPCRQEVRALGSAPGELLGMVELSGAWVTVLGYAAPNSLSAEFALLTLPNLVASHGDGTLRSKFEEFGQVQEAVSTHSPLTRRLFLTDNAQTVWCGVSSSRSRKTSFPSHSACKPY